MASGNARQKPLSGTAQVSLGHANPREKPASQPSCERVVFLTLCSSAGNIGSTHLLILSFYGEGIWTRQNCSGGLSDTVGRSIHKKRGPIFRPSFRYSVHFPEYLFEGIRAGHVLMSPEGWPTVNVFL